MRATARLLLAFALFLAVAATSLPLLALEWIAKPLRFVNVRALAVLRSMQESP